MQTDYTNWAPRVGISYTPTSSVVVRAGYGIYYNHDIANARFDVARNLAGRVTNTSGGGTPGVADINWSQRGGFHWGRWDRTANISPPYSYSNEYSHRTSYSEVFLLDLQKQVGKDWMFEAGLPGQRQQTPLRIPKCELLHSRMATLATGTQLPLPLARPTRTTA